MKTTLTLITVLLLFLVACQPETKPERMEMPFEKYGFTRTTYNDGGFEFLMGNGEMGGRLRYSGLGFEKIWFADYWKSPEKRQFLGPVEFTNADIQQGNPVAYTSDLSIETAVCTTEAQFGTTHYVSKLFFSFEHDDVWAIHVENKSDKPLVLNLIIPTENFDVQVSDNTIIGKNKNESDYNAIAWTMKLNLPLVEQQNRIIVQIPAHQSLEAINSIATPYDTKDFVSFVSQRVASLQNFETVYAGHYKTWKDIRTSIGSVILPDSDYARWFYRCIYTNYATAGSRHFLAAETQFAYPEVDWDMHAFTYGHGSWAALSFIQLGDSARAKRSLQWLYKPESLQANVKILVPDTGQLHLTYKGMPVDNAFYFTQYPTNAFAFGHEQTDFGKNITYPDDSHWDMQFHLNGFASSLFHRYSKFYHDPSFEKEVTTPVVTGTARFWQSLLKPTPEGQYFLPPMLSLSENILKPSVLDAVLSAKWNLSTAQQYADKYGSEENVQFEELAKKLIVPQNDTIYLEYLNDDQQRSGGGYFGIRACAYLGFPIPEQLPLIDSTKARTTLDNAWKRNHYGKGMISFIGNWFALTEAYLKNGNGALEKSKITLGLQDSTQTILYEAFAYNGDAIRARFNPYFLTGYSSFTLVPVTMMLQSYNNRLYFFPAMPDEWNNVSFYDLPAEGGYRVSGVYHSAKDFTVWISKNGTVVKVLHNVSSYPLP